MHYGNYRIVRFVTEIGESFKILPVAYDEHNNIIGLISDQITLHHVSVEDLLHSITHMMAAFSKPVLEYTQFESKSPSTATNQALDILGKKHV